MSDPYEAIVRTGPGTPMGELMREYWIPAAQVVRARAPTATPLRMMLLGEKLIAFRDSAGRVGIMDHRCPHRCASLFYGRNEENGLRCVYHGWKFDADGNCLDMPNVPPHQALHRQGQGQGLPHGRAQRPRLGLYGRARRAAPALPPVEATLVPADETRDRLRAARMQLAAGARGRARHLACRLPAFRLGQALGEARREPSRPRRQPRAGISRDRDAVRPDLWRLPPVTDGPGGTYWRVAHFLFPFSTCRRSRPQRQRHGARLHPDG